MSLHTHFRSQPKWLVRTEAILLVFLTAWADYETGYEASLFVIYTLPILLVVWFDDKNFGVSLAALSAAMWFLTDRWSGHQYTSIWIAAWNTTVQMIFLIFVAIGGAAIKFQIEATRAEVEKIERFRRLEREILEISEREQQRIGQELHDGLCQYLAAIGCAAASLKGDLRARGLPEAGAAAELATLLKEAVVQARNSARGLFPVKDDAAGLESALHELAATSSRLQQITCVFQCDEPVPVRDNTAANHLFRIAQEALNNAVKHGKAQRVEIALKTSGDRMTLSVQDDGEGFTPPPPGYRGMGLRIMDYRVRTMGASWEIKKAESRGTIMTCSLPVSAKISS